MRCGCRALLRLAVRRDGRATIDGKNRENGDRRRSGSVRSPFRRRSRIRGQSAVRQRSVRDTTTDRPTSVACRDSRDCRDTHPSPDTPSLRVSLFCVGVGFVLPPRHVKSDHPSTPFSFCSLLFCCAISSHVFWISAIGCGVYLVIFHCIWLSHLYDFTDSRQMCFFFVMAQHSLTLRFIVHWFQ